MQSMGWDEGGDWDGAGGQDGRVTAVEPVGCGGAEGRGRLIVLC